MKKILLLFCIVFTSFFGFSQIKHITFTDSIKVDVNGFGYVNNYRINAVPNSNDYFLAGTYDNLSYGMNYYIANLDYQGAVIFDTVIEFSTVSSMPYPYLNATVASDIDFTIFSNYENTNYKNQPFIANFDLYGNHNWNKYYEIDTLNFEVRGGIRTDDGGYVIYGFASNWNTMNMSYIIKTDGSGGVIWSKFYGSKNAGDVDFKNDIKTLEQTKDGGFLFASSEYSDFFEVGASLMKLTKIDELGNIVWSNALSFDAPYDNIDGGAGIVSVNVIDSNNVIISATISDTSLFIRRLVLLNVDPLNGNTNWKKSYYLNAGEGNFNVEKIIQTTTGHLAGYFNSDTYGSVLFKLNTTGQFLEMRTNQELPIGNGNTYYVSIANTSDGGVITSANRNSGSGVMLFKTDGYLNTNCPETMSFSLPIEDTLGFVNYSFIDTVYDVVVNELSTTVLTPSNSIESINDNYCSCELNVYGNIDYSSTFADSVMVFLYQITETGKYVKRDSVETDVAGYYQFNYLPEGAYVVKAVPSTIKYPNYLPSYFDFSTPTTQWDSAFVLNLACGNNTIAVDISLIPKLPQSGTWQCSGYVLEYYGYVSGIGMGEKKAPGEPISDIDITLNQSPGGSVNSATTDQNGFFQFTNLNNNNATFVVRACIPGFPNDSIYTFTVIPGDPALDSLNFYVSADSIFILPENILTGIDLIKSEDIVVSIIPNPTTSTFTMEINATSNSKIEVKLMNCIGEIIINNSPNVNIGLNKINFEIQNQPAGIYFLSINYENQHFVKKIVKQ